MAAGRTAARVLRTARRRAGLSQRELARRARTAQSVIARIESGDTSPSWSTLERLLRAAGFRVSAELVPQAVDPSEMEDVGRILRLTPEERLLEVAATSRFIADARRV